jgi:hypothetical protein
MDSSLPDSYCSWSLKCGDCRTDILESGAPILSYWVIPIGCCYEGSILLVQCQLININKLASWEEQGPNSLEVVF